VAVTPAKRTRGFGKRIAALLAGLVLLGALVVAIVLFSHHSARPKSIPIPRIVKVVIPEGFTRAQIAVLARQDGLRGSYLLPSKRSSELELAHYGAPASTPNLEGFLFPATYEMYVGAPAAQLVSEQLTAFHENFGGAEIDRARKLGITPYQLLIVASIIEREAAIAHDRPLVAAVIYNRLRLKMTLGIDSTLRYALHNFSTPLTEAELQSDSPYNTRTHMGPPPTPISNPGLAAIQAAAHPAHVSYLYYVAGADGCGEEVFSTSYAQFEKNAAAYREAIAKNGGRVPACKKR
jgi:cell division protein YceG involved in septum cleavage